MPSLKDLLKGAVRIGYGKYKDKYELEEAELNAWLSIPLPERQEIMKKQSAEYDTPEKRKVYIEKLRKEFNT